MTHVFAFVILLGVLVFFHELGHFIFAKLSGVIVEAFSIGFGKPILKKKIGETEYRLSIFPLGGYVKFYGDDKKDIDPLLKPYTLEAQSAFRKMMIVFAGPMFNFILAFFLFLIMFFVGEPNIAPKVNYVTYESSAWDAGIRAGDKILSVNGENVTVWKDFEDLVKKSDLNAIVKVERNNEIIKIVLPVDKTLSRNKFGELVYENKVIGVSPFKKSTLLGIIPSSFAYNIGFRTSDLILSINGKEILDWDKFEETLESEGFNTDLNVVVKRDKEELTLVIPNLRDYDFSKYSEEKSYFVNNELHGVDTIYSKSNYLGFYSSDLFVTDFVKEESPAKLAGIEKGDRIVAINGVIIRDFSSLQYIIDLKGRESEALELLIERNDSLLVIKVSPESHEIKDETIGLKEKRFLVGIQTHYYPGPSDSKDLIIRNPIKLISVSFINFIEWFWITVVGLFKLITGSVSVKALGGPVMIGKIAGDSFMMGFSYFIKIMAIISINLGIINLLPVPILDGGHIVFFTIEAITGKPVKEKYVERASQVGFYILMLLVALSFYNDIVRFGSKFLGIFK